MEIPSPGLSPVFGPEGEGYPGGGGSIEWFGEDRGPGGPEEGIFSPPRSSLRPRRLMFDNDKDDDGSPILQPRVLFMTPSKSSENSSSSSSSPAPDEIFRSPARWFDLPSLTATDERERNAIFGSAGVYSFPADNVRLVTPPTMTPDQALAAGHVTRYPMTPNDADNAGDRVFNDRYWTYVGNRIQRSIDAGLDVQDRIPVNTLYVEDEDEDDFLMLPVLAIHMSSTQVEERIPGLAQKTDLRRPFRAFYRFFGSNTVMSGLRSSPEMLRIPVGPKHWLGFSLSGNNYALTAIPEAVPDALTREQTETSLFAIEEKPLPETEFVSLWNPKRTIGTDFPDSYPLNCERGMIVVITQDTASDFNDPGRIMMLIKPIPSLMNQ